MATIKQDLIYQGKAKSLWNTADPERCLMEFRNDTSAFDGVKKAQLDDKGEVNNRINAWIMETLAREGVPVHFVERHDATHSLVRRLEMIPLECVVRNRAAGSLCRRLAIDEGRVLDPPVYELFLKSDAQHDPFINDSHALTFGWATESRLTEMKHWTLEVNRVLSALFEQGGMVLVDFKLEFGTASGQLYLGDEISPDGCRIWDRESGTRMDKDRFRQDLGEVIEYYRQVGRRLGIPL